MTLSRPAVAGPEAQRHKREESTRSATVKAARTHAIAVDHRVHTVVGRRLRGKNTRSRRLIGELTK